MRTRYTITNIDVYGNRVLTLPTYGTRWSWATRAEAEQQLALLAPQLRANVLRDLADTLEVRAVACRGPHRDPYGQELYEPESPWFDVPENEGNEGSVCAHDGQI